MVYPATTNPSVFLRPYPYTLSNISWLRTIDQWRWLFQLQTPKTSKLAFQGGIVGHGVTGFYAE